MNGGSCEAAADEDWGGIDGDIRIIEIFSEVAVSNEKFSWFFGFNIVGDQTPEMSIFEGIIALKEAYKINCLFDHELIKFHYK